MIFKLPDLKLLITALAIVGSFIFLALPSAASAQTTTQQAINNGLCAGSNLQLPPDGQECQSAGGPTNATQSLDHFVHTVINLFSAVVGIVAVIMIIVGGFRYVTSGGSDTSVTSAKNTILYAIIGLIIVALSQILVRFTLNKINTG